MKKILCSAAVLALAGSASAGLGDEVFTQSQDFGGELSPFATTLTFDQLDESTLGLNPGEFIEIKAVVLTIDATVSANVAAENDNQQAAPEFGVSLTGFVEASVPSPGMLASASANLLQLASSGGVAGSDGVEGSGPDFFDFGLLTDSGSDDDLYVGPDFSDFAGSGTFDSDVNAAGGFAVTGASNASLFITDFGVEGTVTVEIFYNVIPTPGAMALFGVAGLAAARRRRA